MISLKNAGLSELAEKIPQEGTGILKFANGTMIQYGSVNFPSSSEGGQGYGVVDFVEAFIGTPYVVASPVYAPGIVVFVVSVQPREASLTVYARTLTGGIITGSSARWIAIGRWE